MKIIARLSIIIFTLLFALDVFAQTDIKAEVDKTSITMDDYITYKITITSSERNIPSPQLPKFEGFNVLSQAQSSSISFDKKGSKTTIIFAYILSPKNIGRFKIEPSQAKVKGQTYSTQAFAIEVKPGKTLAPQNNIDPELPQVTL
jgi:hypothetical protein